MHEDELETDATLVRSLLAAQFPHWAGLPIEPVPSSGEGFPWAWGIYTWLEGEHPSADGEAHSDALAADLAGLVQALRRIDLPDGRPSRRGAPLGEVQDEQVRDALRRLEGRIDVDAATAAWDAALAAPPWAGPPVWVHGDLLPGNLLVRDGRLAGVLDWGSVGVGDPACDLVAAWGALPTRARETFRERLDVDDATWARGRGWALSIGLIALPYYEETNPTFAATARLLIREVLANHARAR